MARFRWDDLSSGQKAGLLTLASVQVSLAVSAWTDLAFRPAEQVNGSKLKWAAIIAVSLVGANGVLPVGSQTRGLHPGLDRATSRSATAGSTTT